MRAISTARASPRLSSDPQVMRPEVALRGAAVPSDGRKLEAIWEGRNGRAVRSLTVLLPADAPPMVRGVDGSSPSEGSGQTPHVGALCQFDLVLVDRSVPAHRLTGWLLSRRAGTGPRCPRIRLSSDLDAPRPLLVLLLRVRGRVSGNPAADAGELFVPVLDVCVDERTNALSVRHQRRVAFRLR